MAQPLSLRVASLLLSLPFVACGARTSLDEANAGATVSIIEIIERQSQTCEDADVTCRRRVIDLRTNSISWGSCDGSFSCFWQRYDEQGGLLEWGLDDDCDGIPDDSCTKYGGPEGNADVWAFRDENCDGNPNACLRAEYDGPSLVSAGSDEGCDGSLETNCVYTQSYDPATGIRWLLHDADCRPDTAPNWCEREVWSDGGKRSETGADSECDGIMDHTCRVTFWDETGRPIEEILDLGCSSDFCTTKRYDYNQDLRLQFEDNSCDGTPNSGCTAEGLARSGERPLETDYDCDGVVDSCRREERDAYGNLVRSYEDENCDGTADFFCTDYLYSSPPEGHLPEYP